MCVTDGCACNSPQFSASRPAHDTGAGSDHRPDSRGRAACRQFFGYRLAFPDSLRRAGTLVCLGGCGDLPSGAGALLGEFFFHGHAGASPADALGRMEAGTCRTGPLCADPVLGGGAGGFALPAGAEWPVPLGKADAAHRTFNAHSAPVSGILCPAAVLPGKAGAVRCLASGESFYTGWQLCALHGTGVWGGNALPGIELLRAGRLGSISQFDALVLLVWLAAAMFRFCVLVQVVRQLAGRLWDRATPAEENA